MPRTEAVPSQPAVNAARAAPVRVGVIEVGSRALQLLVADVSEATGIKPVSTRSVGTRLITAMRAGTGVTSVMDMQRIITDFRRRAEELGAERISVFGTEAVHHRGASGIRAVPSAYREMGALDRREEALCSLIAATNGLPRPGGANETILAIDQGGGSIELTLGRTGPPVEMLEFRGA